MKWMGVPSARKKIISQKKRLPNEVGLTCINIQHSNLIQISALYTTSFSMCRSLSGKVQRHHVGQKSSYVIHSLGLVAAQLPCLKADASNHHSLLMQERWTIAHGGKQGKGEVHLPAWFCYVVPEVTQRGETNKLDSSVVFQSKWENHQTPSSYMPMHILVIENFTVK